ncbi:MAG: UDP-N-acetylmuramoylalanine--D-glutamate ligase [Candidatus Vogelbacteria bacterium RIFOXYB1_FULL_42_16]|uniref:UDP-N-acetylmuramoylalanine--D-glutamate ligase n=1 Tax=Candidatus Vogelbacteria bacterium RIFOXYB1_FULL_42_16 TaxID=1802436 RepID=A0A1G2QGL5_9BACT|nr:MAG: UDP-N-acetylmuramoylalanine--D-glutamate ligase [Candidatus Vogelbacteria bacterium RIFOXYB1_FULL_42_16]
MLKQFKKYTKNKKVTVMGLGLLGRGIGVVKFLAECGADLIVTDLKTEEQLASALKPLAKYKNIKYVLGEHRLADFANRDLIIRAANVPMDSIFLAEARKNNIPIEQDASLFVKFVKLHLPKVKIVGVTGTRGKTTVTMLLADILKSAFGDQNVHLGGNIRGLATLPLVKKIKDTDTVLMELDSWQLNSFSPSVRGLSGGPEEGISPHVSVFTNLLVDHQNYYKNSMELYFADKANIYRYQKTGDVIVAGKEIAKKIKNQRSKIKNGGKLIEVNAKNFPVGWKTKLLGEHNLFNTALAVEAARALGVKEAVIKKAVANFAGVPGRLEFVREVKSVKYYNDTTATTPDGVMAALEALKKYQGQIILLGGGADKELTYGDYAKVVKKTVKALALFKGAATDKIITALGKNKIPFEVFDNMKSAFAWAKLQANRGDVVLLSPGAASFGVFKNEYDRGDQFVSLVKKIK